MTDIDRELEKHIMLALVSIHDEGCYWLKAYCDDSTLSKNYCNCMQVQRCFKKVSGLLTNRSVALLSRIKERVVGEDAVEESDDTTPGRYKTNKYLVAENRLRREQRAKLDNIAKEYEVRSDG
jgi:hypothetical protein